MKEYNLEGFERGLFELGITLSEEQKTQFLQYYELLVEWNSFMNLTAITEFDQVITKHFLDSYRSQRGRKTLPVRTRKSVRADRNRCRERSFCDRGICRCPSV